VYCFIYAVKSFEDVLNKDRKIIFLFSYLVNVVLYNRALAKKSLFGGNKWLSKSLFGEKKWRSKSLFGEIESLFEKEIVNLNRALAK
jgi:hypothetical protein